MADYGVDIPGSKNATGGTQCDDVSCRHRTDGGSGCVVCRPREEARTTWESTNGDKENSTISNIRICGPSHDSKASNCRKCENSEVYSTAVRLVRYKSDANGNKTSANIWRYGVELCFSGGPAKIPEKRGL